jgi:hypothetical protein
MTMTRRIGAVAALGGMTAAVALWAALPAARADELAQLKANQQILQQELNKLQQEAKLTAAPVPPGAPSLAGSFPRSILIPGTNTSIQIGGYVDLAIADYITGGGNNSNATQPAGTGGALAAGLPLKSGTGVFSAPLFNPSARSHNWVHLQASESRFFITTRTPTAWGEATTNIEADFWGCTAGGPTCSGLSRATNPDLLRLRLAYGTLGGFIAGQNWVPGNDLQASPTILDFYGSVGTFGYARAPQIGYKFPLGWVPGSTLGVYAVQPETELATPVGGIESDDQGPLNNPVLSSLAINPTKDTLPDFAAVWNLERPWGHFQLHGVITRPGIDDGHLISRYFVGYGGGFSGSVKPFPVLFPRDDLGFNFSAGDGIGHYGGNWTGADTNSTQELISNFGLPGHYGAAGGPTTAAAAALVRFQKVPMWGGEVNYGHWWAPNWETNVDFGVQQQDLNKALLGPAGGANLQFNRRLYTAHLNLLYFPVAFIRTGIEYTYDHRQTIWHQSASANVVMADFQVKF